MQDLITKLDVTQKPVANNEDARRLEKRPITSYIQFANSYEAIRATGERMPEKTALNFFATGDLDEVPLSFSYRETLGAISRTARLLKDFGLGRDDAVLILAPPFPGTYFGLFGAQAIGISTTANPFLSIEHLAGIATSARARAILTVGPEINQEIWEKSCALKKMVESIDVLISATPLPPDSAVDLMAEMTRYSDATLDEEELPSGRDIAAYFHTGGTTGAPKLAKLTHNNQLYSAWTNAAMLDFEADHVTPNGLPLFHVGGAVVIAFRSLVFGQTLAQMTPHGFREPKIARNIWALAEKFGFTQLIGVPTNFIDWYKERPATGETPIRYFSVGAAKPPADLFQNYQDTFGKTLHEGYGMTEFSGWCAANPMAGEATPGSGGIPVPFCSMKIMSLDSNGNYMEEKPTGQNGSIVVSGPCVFAGYVDEGANHEKFVQNVPDGQIWMNTGDMGWLDPQGRVWVSGREKDLIIRGGHNIDPAIIDNILEAHPTVEEAAAVGMPDTRVGELPIAFVKLKEGAKASERDLLQYCRENVSERAAVPVKIELLDDFPRTVMGKLFKPTLRELAAEISVREILASEANFAGKTRISCRTVPEVGLVVHIDIQAASESQFNGQSSLAAQLLANLPITYEFSRIDPAN